MPWLLGMNIIREHKGIQATHTQSLGDISLITSEHTIIHTAKLEIYVHIKNFQEFHKRHEYVYIQTL